MLSTVLLNPPEFQDSLLPSSGLEDFAETSLSGDLVSGCAVEPLHQRQALAELRVPAPELDLIVDRRK